MAGVGVQELLNLSAIFIVCIDFVAISELSYQLLQRVIISACVHSDLPCSIVYKYYTTHHGGTPTLG